MTKTFNKTFKQFLTEYNLPYDFSFSVELPTDVKKIIADQILSTELGITLKSFNRLHKATQSWENQSIIEDSENHFHVERYIEASDNKKAFMVGVKTLTLLAEKFQREGIKGVRFWYSFQTPELGRAWEKRNNFYEEDNECFISDRLSFYKVRDNEDVILENGIEDDFMAILIIDI